MGINTIQQQILTPGDNQFEFKVNTSSVCFLRYLYRVSFTKLILQVILQVIDQYCEHIGIKNEDQKKEYAVVCITLEKEGNGGNF